MPRLKIAGNTKKKKTCVKGFPCGYSCQAQGRNCRKPLKGQAANYQAYLKLYGGGQSTGATQKTSSKKSLSKSQKDILKAMQNVFVDASIANGFTKKLAQSLWKEMEEGRKKEILENNWQTMDDYRNAQGNPNNLTLKDLENDERELLQSLDKMDALDRITGDSAQQMNRRKESSKLRKEIEESLTDSGNLPKQKIQKQDNTPIIRGKKAESNRQSTQANAILRVKRDFLRALGQSANKREKDILREMIAKLDAFKASERANKGQSNITAFQRFSQEHIEISSRVQRVINGSESSMIRSFVRAKKSTPIAELLKAPSGQVSTEKMRQLIELGGVKAMQARRKMMKAPMSEIDEALDHYGIESQEGWSKLHKIEAFVVYKQKRTEEVINRSFESEPIDFLQRFTGSSRTDKEYLKLLYRNKLADYDHKKRLY